MKKRALSLALTLALCLGLAVPVMAADSAVKDTNGRTYTISQPLLGTNDSVTLHDPDPNGDSWERKGTVYVVPMSADVRIPAGVTGTAILCIQYAANQWVCVAYLPLDGEEAVVTFDGPVYLPDPELNHATYRGMIQEHSSEALLIVSSTRDTDERDVGEGDVTFHGDTETYLRNAMLCMVGVKESSKYAYTPVSAFTDVNADDYFAIPVAWAVKNKITSGVTPTAFGPNQTCTTAQILTFLWAANGSPAPSIQNPYRDIDSGDWFYNAAVWACEKGLVSGETFGGEAPCTRSMVVTYLWKLAGSPQASKTAFRDVPEDAFYTQAVAWAVSKGVTSGTGEDTFSPDQTCTRGQIVTFLYRAMGQ